MKKYWFHFKWCVIIFKLGNFGWIKRAETYFKNHGNNLKLLKPDYAFIFSLCTIVQAFEKRFGAGIKSSDHDGIHPSSWPLRWRVLAPWETAVTIQLVAGAGMALEIGLLPCPFMAPVLVAAQSQSLQAFKERTSRL